jgi:hypothetical protein
MTIGQVSSNLLMGTINNRHLAVHKTLKSWVTKATGKGKHMLYFFFM